MAKKDSDIWEKVYHTDARVTAMEGQLSDVNNAVSRIEQHLLNKPTPNVYSLGLTILLGCGTVFFSLAQYVNLELAPIQDQINHRGGIISEFTAFKHQTHYEFGGLHEWKADHTTELQHMDDRMHQIEDRVRGTEIQAATTQNRLEKVEDEIDKIDTYGSRRWSDKSE